MPGLRQFKMFEVLKLGLNGLSGQALDLLRTIDDCFQRFGPTVDNLVAQ